MSGTPRPSGRFRDWNEAWDDPREASDTQPRRPVQAPAPATTPPGSHHETPSWQHGTGQLPHESYGTGHPPHESYGTGQLPHESYGTGQLPHESYGTGQLPYGSYPDSGTAQPYTAPAPHSSDRLYPPAEWPDESPRPRSARRAPAGQAPGPPAGESAGGRRPGAVQPRYAGPPADAQRPDLAEDAWQYARPAPAGSEDTPGPWPTRVSGPPAIGAVGLVVLVAVIAAVGLPRLLSGNTDADVFASTSLVLPEEIAGLPRLPATEVTAEDRRAAEQLLSAVRAELVLRTGVYARPGQTRLTVVTGRPTAALSEDTRTSLRTGFTMGMESAGAPVQDLDPGVLSGWFGCGRTEQGRTLCLAMDAGALVSISVTGNEPSALTIARAARATVERRTP